MLGIFPKYAARGEIYEELLKLAFVSKRLRMFDTRILRRDTE